MRIEIDQSGRIEYTSHKTVLVFSNNKQNSILVPAKIKRQIQKMFRREGKPKLFMLRTFAACIVLLIAEYVDVIQEIVIDKEYPGKERLIKDIILEMLQKQNLKILDISFARIGKKSKAHYIAYGVFKNKKESDKTVSLEELTNLAFKTNR